MFTQEGTPKKFTTPWNPCSSVFIRVHPWLNCSFQVERLNMTMRLSTAANAVGAFAQQKQSEEETSLLPGFQEDRETHEMSEQHYSA